MRPAQFVRNVLARNKMLIAAISLSFFLIIVASAIVSFFAIFTSPALVRSLEQLISSAREYIGIPRPYTSDLYRVIFLNNIGHFWNPVRSFVWIPFLGAFSVGYELLINGLVIGGVISYATVSRGPLYTIAGLTPHGLIEIPAFVLEFAAFARWQLTSTWAIYAKMGSRPVDRLQLKEGLLDTLVLSALSVVLFALAAYVEVFVTPRFLGL